MSKNEIALIQKTVSPLVSRAESFKIIDDKDMVEATKMLSEMNKIGDKIEAEKNKVLRPLLDATKAERARWKPIETMYENGIQLLRQAMGKFQTEKVRLADEAAAKIASRVGEGKGKLKAETAIARIDEIERPAESIATDVGAVKFRTVKKFEVMDITILPIEYHLADESAIKAQMSAGVELPGVRYFEEQVPVNFR